MRKIFFCLIFFILNIRIFASFNLISDNFKFSYPSLNFSYKNENIEVKNGSFKLFKDGSFGILKISYLKLYNLGFYRIEDNFIGFSYDDFFIFLSAFKKSSNEIYLNHYTKALSKGLLLLYQGFTFSLDFDANPSFFIDRKIKTPIFDIILRARSKYQKAFKDFKEHLGFSSSFIVNKNNYKMDLTSKHFYDKDDEIILKNSYLFKGLNFSFLIANNNIRLKLKLKKINLSLDYKKMSIDMKMDENIRVKLSYEIFKNSLSLDLHFHYSNFKIDIKIAEKSYWNISIYL